MVAFTISREADKIFITSGGRQKEVQEVPIVTADGTHRGYGLQSLAQPEKAVMPEDDSWMQWMEPTVPMECTAASYWQLENGAWTKLRDAR